MLSVTIIIIYVLFYFRTWAFMALHHILYFLALFAFSFTLLFVIHVNKLFTQVTRCVPLAFSMSLRGLNFLLLFMCSRKMFPLFVYVFQIKKKVSPFLFMYSRKKFSLSSFCGLEKLFPFPVYVFWKKIRPFPFMFSRKKFPPFLFLRSRKKSPFLFMLFQKFQV